MVEMKNIITVWCVVIDMDEEYDWWQSISLRRLLLPSLMRIGNIIGVKPVPCGTSYCEDKAACLTVRGTYLTKSDMIL